MKGRIDDIEVLRGFAVLLVVLHHAHGNLITWASPVMDGLAGYINGWYGVDLFLAISGFVIARDLLPRLERCEGRHEAVRITLAFWIRRAWRLLPSAWLWLLLILIATRFFNDGGAFGSWKANVEATVAGVLQIANIRFAETFGQTEYGASFPYWSLSLEEQFYFCLPLVALLFRKWLPFVLGTLIALQMVATRDLMLVVFRSDALMLGVLLAIWSRSEVYRTAFPALLASARGRGSMLLVAVILCMGIIGSTFFTVISYKYSVIAVLAILLVWIASYDRDLFVTTPWLRRVLVGVGARSYAIYLIHIPAFFLARELWHRFGPPGASPQELRWPLVITAGLLLLVLTELNYRLVEMPLRRRGKAISDRMLAGGQAAAAEQQSPAPPVELVQQATRT